MKVSIIVPTCKINCEIDWLIDNLYYVQTNKNFEHQLIIVDDYAEERKEEFIKLNNGRVDLVHVLPKPNVWRGKHRLSKFNIYALCNARNTGLCYAKHSHIITMDDTCVPMDGWLDLHLEAAKKGSILSGRRHKAGYEVENGKIINIEKMDKDVHRGDKKKSLIGEYAGEGYNNNLSFPLEMALEIDGWDEKFDGQYGVEDCDFSIRLSRLAKIQKTEMVHDPACESIEQQIVGTSRSHLYCDHTTPEGYKSGMRSVPKWTGKTKKINGRFANEALIWNSPEGINFEPERIHPKGNPFNMRELRNEILIGKAFSIPTKPDTDWRDGQLIKDFTNG